MSEEVAMEREKLIEAAKMLKKNCYNACSKKCPFYIGIEDDGANNCVLTDELPCNWEIPEVKDND